MDDLVEEVDAPEPSRKKASRGAPTPLAQGIGVSAKRVPSRPFTPKEMTQEKLALCIVLGVIFLNAAVIFIFLFGWTSSEEGLSTFMLSLSSLQTLAAGVVGFYFGESRIRAAAYDGVE